MRIRLIVLLVSILVFGFPVARAGEHVLPPQLAFTSGLITLRDDAYIYPGYLHSDWTDYDFGDGIKPRGKYWRLRGTLAGNLNGDEQWAKVKEAFIHAGWTIVRDSRWSGVLQHKTGGAQSYAAVGQTDGDVVIEMIEVAPNPLKIALRPPSATPEKMDSDKGDFPFLTPPPGAKLKGGHESMQPFMVTPPGASQAELIANKALSRDYERPIGLANLEFVTAYQDALIKAGWEIVSVFNSADASIMAHYAKRGRNLWMYMHLNGQELSILVADGTQDWKASLSKECHVALYGVLFDFNKATLQPVSAPLLQRVAALLQKSPTLKVEIQGHTDNVGDDAYNQKLSESRAAAVVAWLTKHGVAASRLSSRGYGKTQPIADNGDDEGRAKNRRVEIADPSCKTAKNQ